MTNNGIAQCLADEQMLLSFREYCKLHRPLDHCRLSALVFLTAQEDLKNITSKSIRQLHAKFLEPNAPNQINYFAECLVVNDLLDLKFWLQGVLVEAFDAFQHSDYFKLSRKREFVSPPLSVRKKGLLRRPHFDHASDEWFHMQISTNAKLTSQH